MTRRQACHYKRVELKLRLMDKVFIIIKREYLARVRTKGFILSTILTPLLLASTIVIPMLFVDRSSAKNYRLIILDQTNDQPLYTRTEQLLTENNQKGDKYEIVREALTADKIEERKQILNADLKAEKINGYVVLPSDFLSSGKLQLRVRNVNDFSNNRRIENAFNAAVIEQRMIRAGVNPAQASAINKEVHLDFIDEKGEKESGMAKWGLSFLLAIILYVTILIYGLQVMQGVIEEKQSRIIEVLLSSVKPFQLMLGKVIGIGSVSLTQVTVWALSLGLVSAIAAAQALAFGSFKLPAIPFSLLFFFIIYYILGYFLFATLYAIVGSMVSSQEDGQQAQMPITLLVALPMTLATFIMTKPDSTLSTVLSLIPFFAPILMFMRITVQQPPMWQIVLSIVLMLLTIWGAVWVAAKIYRVGVLMYGKRPSLPELVKWLKYT